MFGFVFHNRQWNKNSKEVTAGAQDTDKIGITTGGELVGISSGGGEHDQVCMLYIVYYSL